MAVLDAVTRWDVDAAAAAVVAEDSTVVESIGPADRQFELASVTKLLTATAILVAVEEGTLSLDLPAGPEGSTLRHLLAHTSGLAFDEPRVLAPPGRRRIYSNVGIEEAAAALETAAGFSFETYLREAVLDPLAMGATRLDGSPAAGASSTLEDIARFAAELLQPTLLSAETFAVATHVVFPGLDGLLPGIGTQKPNDWGLGFEIRDGKSPHWTGARNSPATFGHFGGSGTFLWVDPVARLACVMLTNRGFDEWALEAWPQLSDAVIETYATGS